MRRSIPFLFLLLSCGPGKEKAQTNDSTTVNPNGENVVRSRYANGKTRSEVVYKDGKKNGISRSFDSDGGLVLELPYVNNMREGQSKKYYTGGKVLAQTTEYKADMMEGIQTKYRGNGNKLSEQRYKNDFPCADLKEYLENQQLKKKYPTIDIKVIDNLKTTGIYTLKISLSERVRAVKYYTGKLTPDGCLNDDLDYILLDEATKTAELTWRLVPGSFVMEEVNIIATFETLMGNTAIVQRKYHVALNN